MKWEPENQVTIFDVLDSPVEGKNRKSEGDVLMKLDTEEKKLAFVAGYFQAMAQQLAEEFDRDIEEIKKELLEGVEKNANKNRKFT